MATVLHGNRRLGAAAPLPVATHAIGSKVMDSRDMETRNAGRGGSAGRDGSAGSALATGPVERLAAECLARLGAGETVDVEAASAELADEADRAQLRDIIEDAQRIQGLLPAQVRPGLMLKGRYRLVREIGSGGMGKVYEAVDCQLERRVAVKILAALGTQSFDPEQLFMQEAVLLASLQHPNIVAVHELGTDGDITFIVMDLVQGTSVSEVLTRVATAVTAEKRSTPRRGRLLEEAIGLPLPAGRASIIQNDSWFRAAARVVLEVTRTIEEAHGHGVIHRDIKPHNILLRGDGSPVILDFGLAGTLDRAQGSITRGLFGTVGYLAPEQVASSRIGIDRRTDVYQLGLLLYEFLTLQRAFPGEQITALLSLISHGEFRRPRSMDPGIPYELEAICLKAMELDPARRYATATALREDLERFLDGSEVPLAARGGALAASARSCRYFMRRNKPGIAIAATVIVALLVVIGMRLNAPVQDGDIAGFTYNEATGVVTHAPADDTVGPGELLGVEVKGDTAQYVYALSVFGEQDPPSFVAPMRPRRLGETDSEWLAQPMGRRIEPGESMNCTKIAEDSKEGASECLWIFTSREAKPELEAWMKHLSTLAMNSPNHAVTLAQAQAAFRTKVAPPPLTRGDPAPQQSEQAAAQQASNLDAASLLSDEEWPFSDPKRLKFVFRVER